MICFLGFQKDLTIHISVEDLCIISINNIDKILNFLVPKAAITTPNKNK